MKKEKVKKQYPEDFRTLLGFSTTSWIHGFAVMVFALFMQFITDYSGIDAAIGQVGFAVAFGTTVLLVTRIIDAVDDPIQAWIMDRAKEKKFGKYRMFTLWSILLMGIGITVMFTLPEAVKSNAVLLSIWVFVGYLMFEMGFAFNGIMPIVQKATYDPIIRSKLTSLIRMAIILAVIPATFFIPIATAVNSSIGNMGLSFSLTCAGITIFSCVISLIGVLSLREPYRPNIVKSAEEHESEKLKVKDVLIMISHNKPLWVHNIAYLFGNMSFAVATSVLVYFLKWFYCADLATGVVDNIKYASLYGIYALLALIPAFLTPLVASLVVKKLKTIDRAMRVCTLLTGLLYGAIFISYLLGLLQSNPAVFLGLCFLAGLPANIAVIPAMLLTTESADYVEYKTGKNMSALVNSVTTMLSKGQSAIAVIIPGIVLMAVGYSVNAVTGNYAGDLTRLPEMVQNLTLIITLVPLAVSVISWAMYKYLYPITPEFRKMMTDELISRRNVKLETDAVSVVSEA